MLNIPVLYSFARSGGTLVNQLLGSHPGCMVLSEVNPAASYKPVVQQAVEWLGLVDASDASAFAELSYRQQIARLHELAGERGKKLVVRDWVSVNFLPLCAGDRVVPSGQLEQQMYLEGIPGMPVPMVVTRRAASVYRSVKASFPHLREVGPEGFAIAYGNYAKAVAHLPRVHLEALRANPEAVVTTILERFGLDVSHARSILDTFHRFRNCTGNTTLVGHNDSAVAQRVLPPPITPAGGPDQAHPSFLELDRLLGYDS